ncbi:hypothetical protein D3C71_2127960 [compost metagenome]
MSPRTTFNRLGNSSRLLRRSQRPIGVTRGSLSILKSMASAPCLFRWRTESFKASALATMVRNLYMPKVRPR